MFIFSCMNKFLNNIIHNQHCYVQFTILFLWKGCIYFCNQYLVVNKVFNLQLFLFTKLIRKFCTKFIKIFPINSFKVLYFAYLKNLHWTNSKSLHWTYLKNLTELIKNFTLSWFKMFYLAFLKFVLKYF